MASVLSRVIAVNAGIITSSSTACVESSAKNVHGIRRGHGMRVRRLQPAAGLLSDTSTELSTVIPRSDYHDNAAEMITRNKKADHSGFSVDAGASALDTG